MASVIFHAGSMMRMLLVLRMLLPNSSASSHSQGVELEQRLDALVIHVDKGEVALAPADLFHRNPRRLHAGLYGGVAQVVEVAAVLFAVTDAGEMHVTVAVLGLEPLPLLDQRLMQAVELVSVRPELRLHVLQPVPLRDAGLNQRGRGVGIEFEQFGRAIAVPGQIKATEQRRMSLSQLSRISAQADSGIASSFEAFLLDDVLGRSHAHVVELFGGFLEILDLAARKVVADPSSQYRPSMEWN